ncbi:MAG: MFS transporter [Nitrospiraceae bacterium]|nr:MFS transporter [Nitrospiraceae bacterium]
MSKHRLLPGAWVALSLSAVYSTAAALCSVFVSVYLWINSQDLGVIYSYYLALFVVTPVFFLLSGWYSQARDRLHVYRLGLVLHAVLYATFLVLRERSPEYALWLGALQGVTWGCYWAGANTLNYDVSAAGKREYYFGLLHGTTGIVKLLAPVAAGFIIRFASEPREGYHLVFGVVVLLFLLSFALSFLMPPDNERRPFHLRRALFPGSEHRDWRLVMLASASMSGSFTIFAFLLTLLMYIQTGDELSVGAYAAFQSIAVIVVPFFVGSALVPRNRRTFMRWGVILLVAAGALMAFKLSVVTLVLFGLLRSIAQPLFGIPHTGLRLDIISESVENPAQRIEYLCAWEIPLAAGRIIMMLIMMALYGVLAQSEVAVRISLFVLCAIRILSYQLLIRTSPMRRVVS